MKKESNDKLQRLPVWKNFLEALRSDGKPLYGTNILWSEMLEAFGVEDLDSWKFRKEYLPFREELKALGYFTTETGMEDKGIRILKREEVAAHVKADEYRKAHHSIKNALGLGAIDTDGLPHEVVSGIDYMQRKSGLIGAESLRVLRRRKLPASPEMEIKSVKQIT